jgi:hypothetical protein
LLTSTSRPGEDGADPVGEAIVAADGGVVGLDEGGRPVAAGGVDVLDRRQPARLRAAGDDHMSA